MSIIRPLVGFAVALALVSSVKADVRITEYMYAGANGEFVEFTNLGSQPVDMTGWSFDDDSREPGSFDLSAFGVLAPGESVVLTETAASEFRTAWSLDAKTKVLGGLDQGLGRNDEINLYDAQDQLIDRLAYGDQTFPGTPRTQNISAWVSVAGVGTNDAAAWTLSMLGDPEGSLASTGGDIASPGRSTLQPASNPSAAPMRITEWMYSGPDGEFIEFTNIGDEAVSLVGWTYDDDSADPAQGFDLSGFGLVQPGESVLITESDPEAFRVAWALCNAVRVLGPYSNTLGRADEINLYNAEGELVDRLAFGDNRPPPFPQGTIRTQDASGWAGAGSVEPAAVVNDVTLWTLSALGDTEGSYSSSGGAIGNPGTSSRASVAFNPCASAGQMRITEYMYAGSDGEFVEFTNVGAAAISMIGYSYSDDAQIPGTQDLSAFAFVQPGESVILTESSADSFRSAWALCDGVKVVGGLTANLGRADEINLYDDQGKLVDRLTYGDNRPPPFPQGSIRTQNVSGWVSADGLGTNDITEWTLSELGDPEDSQSSVGGDLGSPGRSQRALFDYDPCVGVPGGPRINANAALLEPFLDLPINGGGAASGVIADPTDPLATRGFHFLLEDSDHAVEDLLVEVISTNTQVVPANFLLLTGSGEQRRLRVFPAGVGYTTLVISVTDPDGKIGSYTIAYAASAPSVNVPDSRFHTGASDGSTAVAVDAQTMLIGDDEDQALRLYSRSDSGLFWNAFDFTGELELPESSDGQPLEVDIEASARIGDRIYWMGSHGNDRSGELSLNRSRIFANDLSGSGSAASLGYVGRYDHLRDDLIAWDQANGHGLGADALGFAAGTADGVLPTLKNGFNIEALTIAPDGSSALLGFRAPQLPLPDRDHGLIVPLQNLQALVSDGEPLPAGSAEFGAPMLLNLGGRALRAMSRASSGKILIIAGPAGSDDGMPPNDFQLYEWSGSASQAPLAIDVPLTKRIVGGSFEGIVDVPDGATGTVQLIVDNGAFEFYNDGEEAKDLAELRHRKFRSEQVEVSFDLIFGSGME